MAAAVCSYFVKKYCLINVNAMGCKLAMLYCRICVLYPWKWDGARDRAHTVWSSVAEAAHWKMWSYLWRGITTHHMSLTYLTYA